MPCLTSFTKVYFNLSGPSFDLESLTNKIIERARIKIMKEKMFSLFY